MAVTEEMLSGRSEIDRRVFPRCFRGDTGPKASGGPRFDALGAGFEGHYSPRGTSGPFRKAGSLGMQRGYWPCTGNRPQHSWWRNPRGQDAE
jgi:hypothetical protein